MVGALKQGRRSEVNATGTAAPLEQKLVPLTEAWQRIAKKAYELYEQRGRREGCALQDWLDAEYLLNQEVYETH